MTPRATIGEYLFRPRATDYDPVCREDEELAQLARVGLLIDYRGLYRTGRNSKGKTHGTRGPEAVTAVCLHQTAVMMSHKSALRSQYHSLIYPDGTAVLCHPATAYLWHARKANRFSVGVALVCCAAGVEGNPRTLWRPKSEPSRQATEATDAQLKTARAICGYYLRTLPNLRNVIAHRQSSRMRRSDPGSRIWQHVALQVDLCPGATLARGLPLPSEWTGETKDLDYYGRRTIS